MEDKVEYGEDVKAEVKQVSESVNQDQKHDDFPSSKSCTHGKAELGDTQVVNCNGKEELTSPLGLKDEKKDVPELVGGTGNSVQGGGDGEKMVLFSETRPATMQAHGPHGVKNQLTIFFDGKVCVFDSIPAEKVQEILFLATAVTTKPGKMNDIEKQTPSASPVPTTLSPSPQTPAPALAPMQGLCLNAQDSSLCRLQEIPIARRHSLQRFLEKRRDRLATKSPYPSPSPKNDDDLQTIHGDKNSSDSVNLKPSEEEFRSAAIVAS